MPFSHKAIVILFGSVLISMGVNFFLSPFEILDGGIIGIGLIFKYLWGVKAGLTIILFSLPIFGLAWKKYRPYFYNSLHGMLVSSFVIDLFQPFQGLVISYIHLHPVTCALIGGILVGTGIGVMLRYETSTGGLDLLAQFCADKYQLNVGILIFFIDAVIITLGGLLLPGETIILSLITVTAVGFSTSICTLKRYP